MIHCNLAKVPAKLGAKYVQQAIKAVSDARNIDFLSCEEKYTNTRSALAHLLKHDRYRTHIADRVHEIVTITRDLLAQPGVERLSRDPNWVTRLAEATDDLERAKVSDMRVWDVVPEDFAIFLDVVEEARSLHVRFKFDPGDIVPSNMFVLASLARGNFAAYEKTLNT